MMTLLALMAQTVTLDADPYIAAQTCAVATVQSIVARDRGFTNWTQTMFYMLHGARTRPADTPMLDRITDMLDADTFRRPVSEAEQTRAKLLVPICEKRFARPVSTTAAQLPAEAVERDMMCLSVLLMLEGGATVLRSKSPDDPWLDRIEPLFEPIKARLDSEVMARKNIKNMSDFIAWHDRQLAASVDLGDPLAVARACGLRED